MDDRYCPPEQTESPPPAMCEHGYSLDERTTSTIAPATCENDLPPLDSGFLLENDPRLHVVLEFFKELYVERRELFKKFFPRLQDEFVVWFKKFVNTDDRVKFQTMQRSLSLGSPRMPSRQGDESPLRLERFKVRTIIRGGGGVQQDGQGGQADTRANGSK
ncbi:hypothetical protein L1049_011757 [Liquidambar formosana]|uniref:Uncharacterized protein n=1 Tax=Liquidambar formosana TaxID=63359 RepID=A0AAP0X019_LIQFO